MADFVLDLGRQRELASEGGRSEDPLAFRQHAHQLAVGVHLDEAQDALPVFVRHPVARLDLAARENVLLERGVAFVVRQLLVEGQSAALAWRQDGLEGDRIGHRAFSGSAAGAASVRTASSA